MQSMADRYPGEAVVFDVKCSASLPKLISELGMRPVMHRSGHSFMKQKMQVTGAPLDMFTMLIGSIAIGLSVDDTVHFLTKYQTGR